MMETVDPSDHENRQKQAACLECRKSKTKCIRTEEGSACRKCETSGAACVVPAYHVGRYKGVKNKRSGLEKAISQVEKAIKKSRNGDPTLDPQQTQALEQLLRQTNDAVEPPPALSYSPVNTGPPRMASVMGRPQSNQAPALSRRVSFVDQTEDAGELTVNNADNPLQLLAIASAIPESSPSVATPSSNHRTPNDSSELKAHESSTQKFFRPIRSKLDLSKDLDPIDLGLASEDDARRLFTFFHEYLAHTRWGMDPAIHTWSFVRSRSAFLLTSVMAASALFLPDTAALSTRLRNHVKKSIGIIVAEKHRSVEIVLALMINVPWMMTGEEWAANDDTCYYISTALTIALDLSINRIVVPSSVLRPPGFLDRIAKADCIDASKALSMDCFDDINPSSELGRRLLRTRERAWLALFNLDRGVCLARGRPPTVPISPLVDSCDTWHICDIAEPQDGALVSSTFLRRDFVGLVSSIRTTCDNNTLTVGEDSTTVRVMRDRIERFFDQWYDAWKFQIRQHDGRIPPYVEILASHTKLSAYCNVINHPTAPADVRKFFRAAGLASALNVLKVAVQAESRLRSMPNNTVIMVSFAAFFVLGLGGDKSRDSTLMTTSTMTLIEEIADVLQRLGSMPEHRQGASVWFGKHLRAIVQQSSVSPPPSRSERRRRNELTPTTRQQETRVNAGLVNHYNMAMAPNMGHNMHGSTIEDFPVFDMTNDQIIDAITNSKDDIDALNADYVYDESQYMDWFDSWG